MSETAAQERIISLHTLKSSITEQIARQQQERLDNTVKALDERQKQHEFQGVADIVRAEYTTDEDTYVGKNEEVRKANLKIALEQSTAYTEAISQVRACERAAHLYILAAQTNSEQIAVATALLGRIGSYDPFHGE